MLNLATVKPDMLRDLFEQAKATPRRLLAFQSADGIRFEAHLSAHRGDGGGYTLFVYVRAEQYDDDIRCDHDSGEDWVRKALEGAGLEYIEARDYDFDTHWRFARLDSRKFYGTGRYAYGDEFEFWAAALAELQRAQATHACGGCQAALTTNDRCPACWAAWAAAAAAPTPGLPAPAEPVCPGAPQKKKPRRSARLDF